MFRPGCQCCVFISVRNNKKVGWLLLPHSTVQWIHCKCSWQLLAEYVHDAMFPLYSIKSSTAPPLNLMHCLHDIMSFTSIGCPQANGPLVYTHLFESYIMSDLHSFVYPFKYFRYPIWTEHRSFETCYLYDYMKLKRSYDLCFICFECHLMLSGSSWCLGKISMLGGTFHKPSVHSVWWQNSHCSILAGNSRL